MKLHSLLKAMFHSYFDITRGYTIIYANKSHEITIKSPLNHNPCIPRWCSAHLRRLADVNGTAPVARQQVLLTYRAVEAPLRGVVDLPRFGTHPLFLNHGWKSPTIGWENMGQPSIYIYIYYR